MSNQVGQYNCFLNVVIQSLWHLKSFQDAFATFPEHTHTSDKSSCVLCALYLIFHEYRESNGGNLSSLDLRTALSEAFAAQQRFQEGVMADAGECYIELISLVANLLPNEESRQRLVNALFDTVMVERVVCSICDHTEDKPALATNTHLLIVSKVVEAAAALGEKPFDELIGASFQGDSLPCPKCKEEALITKRFKSLPAVYTLSLVWPTSRPRRTFLNDFFNTISMEIDLRNLCSIDMKGAKKQTSKYRLRGMILYYGRHYTAVFYHASLGRWLRFDDSRVDPVARHWHELTDWCVQSRFQPSVLFYERENVGSKTDFYDPVPQDVIPRPLREPAPAPAFDPQIPAELAPKCPALEGPVYRKNKKQWTYQWAKLHDWTLSFYSKAQKAYSSAHGRWVQTRRDAAILVLPIGSLASVEMDTRTHNFSRKPFYMKISVSSDTASSDSASGTAQTPGAVAAPTPAEEYILYVEQEAPFVQWISALNRASELLQQMKNTDKDVIRRRSRFIDNDFDTPSYGALTGGTSSIPLDEARSALEFAPNASLDDLARIAQMESGSPRDEDPSSSEDEKTTILHPAAATAQPPAPAASNSISSTNPAPVQAPVPSTAPQPTQPKPSTGAQPFYDPFQDE
jgi:hypothetical protein